MTGEADLPLPVQALSTGSLTDTIVLRVLHHADQHSTDPSALLDSLAKDFPRKSRRQMRQLSRQIRSGKTPARALTDHKGWRRSPITQAVALAERCGYQSRLLGDWTKHLDAAGDSDVSAQRHLSRTIHLVFLFTFACFVNAFHATFVLPTLREMSEEFEFEDSALLAVSLWIVDYAPWAFLLIGFVLLILILTNLKNYFGSVLQKLSPLRSRQSRWSARTTLLPLVATGLAGGAGISKTLSTLSDLHPSQRWKRRLGEYTTMVDQDASLGDALRRCRLVSRRESRALDIASSSAAQIRLLEDFSKRRRRFELIRARVPAQLLSLLISIALAVIVVVLAITLFEFLSTLIQSVSRP